MSSFARLQHRLCRATLLVLGLLPAALAAQTTRRVPQDFPTIQSAINASATGDTISVAPGTYTENLTISGIAITLASTAGAPTTILDGAFNGPVLTIAGTPSMATTVTGFTIQHGLASGSGSSAAGILLTQSGAVLSSNQLLHNAGANIAAVDSTVSVLNNSISTAPSDRGSGTNCDGGTGVAVSGSTAVTGSNGQPLPSTVTGNTIFGDSTRCSGTAIDLETTGLLSPHLIANNTLRNSALGLNLATDPGNGNGGVIVRQNLIYDNANGAITLTGPTTHPSTDPALVLFVNNTVVNNLNQPAASPLTEISLTGTAAHTAFINNILVGTTSNPVLTCDTGTPSFNDTPLILDHTDLYNTTQAPGGLIAGDCATGISNQLTSNGNLSADPHLNNSTDLHLAANSPAIDAGTNSAPTLTATDFDGNPRIVDATSAGFPTVDLGAYEYAGTADSGTTALALTASTYQTPPGSVTLTATCTAPDGSHPAGTITFTQQGSTGIASRPNSSGVATVVVSLATPGVAAFTAAFAPDPAVAVAPTITPVLYIDVTTASAAATSTLTLAANPTSLTTAQSTTLTVQLGTSNDGGAIPTGTVQLTDNGNALATLQPSSTSGLATFTFANPSAGTHSLVASYAGNSSFTPASANTSITVAALLPSTLSITANSATGFAGQPLTLSIQLGSLTTTGSPGPVPPGAVTLYSSSPAAGTLITTLQPDSSGSITYTIANPPAGNVTYTVRYAGNTTYAASSASTSTSLAANATTTTTLTAAPSPATIGTAVTLTATISNTTTPSAAPVGSVRFTEGNTLLGTATVSSTGTATLSLSTLAIGTHTLTASFVPSPGYLASSASTTLTIVGQATATILTSAHNPAGPSDLVAYTATVSLVTGTGPAPTGTITLTDGAALLASGTLSPLSATTSAVTLSAIDPALGTRSLVATYNPGPAFSGSSATLLQTIAAAPAPVVTLAVTPNPALITSPVTLAVTVANPPAGATLALLDGATPLPLSPTLTAATYTLPAGTLAIGTHTLSAALRDANGNLLTTSTPIAEHITSLTATLALTASPSPSALVGTTITLTAALAASTPSTHIPTGAITFLDGSQVLGSTPIDATGHASLSTATLAAGTHTLSATWPGDDLLSPATATALPEQLLLNPTATTLVASALGTAAFAPVTLTAQVTSAAATPLNTAVCTPACAPTTVTFFNGSSALGTVSVDATGRASLTINPPAGGLTFTAAFSGSPLFSPSASASVPDVITLAPTALTLTGSPNPLYQRGSVTLTAALASSPGMPAAALAGSPITLLDGTTPLGTITSPTGTLAYTPTTTGTHTLTATFAGTANLTPAAATLTLTVLPSDFTIAVQDTALTIQTEHHAPTTVTLTMSGDLTDTIDLSCDNPPYIVSCTFATSSMPLSASSSPTQTTQLIVDTDFIERWASLRRPRDLGPTPGSPGPGLPALAATLALALPTTWLLTLRRRRSQTPGRPRSPLPNLLAALLFSAATLGLVACGSIQPGHTPPGTYPLVITAHARTHNFSHTATITLTVTP